DVALAGGVLDGPHVAGREVVQVLARKRAKTTVGDGPDSLSAVLSRRIDQHDLVNPAQVVSYERAHGVGHDVAGGEGATHNGGGEHQPENNQTGAHRPAGDVAQAELHHN